MRRYFAVLVLIAIFVLATTAVTLAGRSGPHGSATYAVCHIDTDSGNYTEWLSLSGATGQVADGEATWGACT